MQAVTTIGLDIAKSVFQVHGVDAAGWARLHRKARPVSGLHLRLFAHVPTTARRGRLGVEGLC
jgi:hypothetical protein